MQSRIVSYIARFIQTFAICSCDFLRDGLSRVPARREAGDVVMVRHGAVCLAMHAARKSQDRKGRLSSRLGTAEALIESFSLDPATYQCVDSRCRGAAKQVAQWWWYLVVAGGAVLVMCICAGGVLFSAIRNAKTPRQDETQDSVKDKNEHREETEEGAGVGPLVPRP